MKNFLFKFGFLAIFAFVGLVGCGEKSSSSSSNYSGPSGFDSEQRSKYNNLTPEGKKYVDEQMRAYDKSR